MKTRANIIEEILQKENIRKTELAKRMGITRQSIYCIFIGKDISKDRFTALLDVLGYTCDITIRKLGYRKVSPEELASIVENVAPKGLFWAKNENDFIAVNTFGEEALIKHFKTKEECTDYLGQI